MAPKDPLVIARAWCSSFKLINTPNTLHIINTQNKLRAFVTQLPEFFASLEKEINPKIISRSLVRKYYPNQFLLVLGMIAKALNTTVYTKEILENDDIEPKKQIIIIGYTPEVIFINYFANYLLAMGENLMKTNTHLSTNGRQRKAEREKQFFMPLYNILKLTLPIIPLNAKLQKRFEKQLHLVFNTFKFDHNKKRKNLEDTPKWENIIITTGKWKKHHILWGI